MIGIRPGEKLHEEMLSFEESLRTKEYDKYYMITDNIINSVSEGYAYSSEEVLNKKDVYNFLTKKQVI